MDDWKEFAAKHPECIQVSCIFARFYNLVSGSLDCWYLDDLTQTLFLSFFLQSVAVSTGTSDGDFERLGAIMAAVPQIQYICVDVANGYSEHFVNFVKDVRKMFPTHTIMVSYLSTWNR